LAGQSVVPHTSTVPEKALWGVLVTHSRSPRPVAYWRVPSSVSTSGEGVRALATTCGTVDSTATPGAASSTPALKLEKGALTIAASTAATEMALV
jgi:hypothetical protein